MINIDFTKQIHTASGTKNLSLKINIENGTFLIVTGESGCGKTSLLKILAGLIKPENGKIIVNNQWWFDSKKKINLETSKRNIGFAFQDYVLFPNMTVYENINFGSKDKKLSEKLIDEMDLKELANRLPAKLSGGQKQRVALARAIARKSKLLLLDEPMSALDDNMRYKMQNILKQYYYKYKPTIVMITHNIDEIKKLSSRIISLKDGKICSDYSYAECIDTCKNIYLNKNKKKLVAKHCINHLKLVK